MSPTRRSTTKTRSRRRDIRASCRSSRTCRGSIARARSSRAVRRSTSRATRCSSPATTWAPATGAATRSTCACRPSGSCRCPAGLTLRETMIYGTAGFTAAQCVTAIVDRGIEPERGPVVVTGATGGVGSLAVAILAKLGYEVAAVTGKPGDTIGCSDWGRRRFSVATTCSTTTDRPLLAARWAAAVDTVGGKPLATILRSTRASRLRRRLRPGRGDRLAAHRLSVHPPRRDARRHRLGQVPAAAAARDVAEALRPVADRPARRPGRRDYARRIARSASRKFWPARSSAARWSCRRSTKVAASRSETAGSIRRAPSSSPSPRCS